MGNKVVNSGVVGFDRRWVRNFEVTKSSRFHFVWAKAALARAGAAALLPDRGVVKVLRSTGWNNNVSEDERLMRELVIP